jgi:hypothetical protein
MFQVNSRSRVGADRVLQSFGVPPRAQHRFARRQVHGHADQLTELSRHHIFLVCPARDNPQCIIRQRSLQCLGSSHGARIQTSYSSSVVRITGMAFGWMGSTTAFGAVVRKP